MNNIRADISTRTHAEAVIGYQEPFLPDDCRDTFEQR